MYTWIGIQHVEVHEAENIEAGHDAETAGYVHCRVVHRAVRSSTGTSNPDSATPLTLLVDRKGNRLSLFMLGTK